MSSFISSRSSRSATTCKTIRTCWDRDWRKRWIASRRTRWTRLISSSKWIQSLCWIWVGWSKIRCFHAVSSYRWKDKMVCTGCATWPWKTRLRNFSNSRQSTCSHTRTRWRRLRSKKATLSLKSWLVACRSLCESSRQTYSTCSTMAASELKGRSKNQTAKNRLVWIRGTHRSVSMTNYRRKLRPSKTIKMNSYYHSTQGAVTWTTRIKTTRRRSSVSVEPKTFYARRSMRRKTRKINKRSCKWNSKSSKAPWLTLERRHRRSFLTLILTKRDARKPSTN